MTFRAVLFAHDSPTQAGAVISLYGLSMLERQIRLMASLGAQEVVVVESGGAEGQAIKAVIDRLDPAWIVPVTCCSAPDARRLWSSTSGPVLLVDTHQLYDARILDHLLKSGPDTVVIDPESPASCHLALLSGATLDRLTTSWPDLNDFWQRLTAMPQEGCARLDLRKINPYVVNLRRSLPVYWLPVHAESDAKAGEALLIDAAQKGTLDWPAQYVHPPFENRLTAWIARTRITPNQATTFTNVIAFVATGLLATGYLATGWVLAAIVGVLDGVDGKLARVTVRCTRFGDRYEHILDNVYELSWYWALGWTLYQGEAAPLALVFAAVMTVFYLLDRAATGLFKHRRGIELFDVAPLDRFFRGIGGRRNIYVYILLAGAAAQYPLAAFGIAAGWAIVTALFHWTRALWLLTQHPEQVRAAMYAGEAAS